MVVLTRYARCTVCRHNGSVEPAITKEYLMRITKMRIKGEVPSTEVTFEIERTLRNRLAKAGYITNVNALTRTALKIGLHMRSFKLDLTKHDRNLRHNPYLPSKLTDTPTWDQRVEFNDIVNAVLNKFKVSARVVSGPFTIRDGVKCMNENDWYDQKPAWITHNESRGWYVESVNERAFTEERRLERNEKARARRAQKKADELALANDAKRVLRLV